MNIDTASLSEFFSWENLKPYQLIIYIGGIYYGFLILRWMANIQFQRAEKSREQQPRERENGYNYFAGSYDFSDDDDETNIDPTPEKTEVIISGFSQTASYVWDGRYLSRFSGTKLFEFDGETVRKFGGTGLYSWRNNILHKFSRTGLYSVSGNTIRKHLGTSLYTFNDSGLAKFSAPHNIHFAAKVSCPFPS